jgi:hypothetical protein
MTAKTATQTTKTTATKKAAAARKAAAVTVTAINRGYGDIELHRPGCRDLERDAASAAIWNIRVRKPQDVVFGIYDPSDFEYDPSDWEQYVEAGYRMMPCCPALDGSTNKRNKQWARQLRAAKRLERELAAAKK